MEKTKSQKKIKADIYLKKLQNKLKYYRQVVIDSNNAIIIQDFKGIIKAWNRGAERIYGFKEGEMLGRNIIKIICKEDRASAKTNIRSIKNGKPSFIVKQTRITKDNKKVFVNITYSPIYDLEEVVEIATTEEDVSELKKSLENIKNAVLKYKRLFDYMIEAVVIYEVKNNGRDIIIKDVNRAAEKLEKVSKKDVVGKRVEDVFAGVKKFGLYDVFKKVWKTARPIHHPISFYEDKFRRAWRENYVFKLPPDEVVAVYTDVTKTKQSEETPKESLKKIKENEKKYEDLFNNAVDAIFIADVKTKKLVSCNKAAEKLLEYPRKEICRLNAKDLHPGDLVKDTMIGFKAQANGTVKQIYSEVLTKTKKRIPVSINSSVIYIENKPYLQGIFRDISEQVFIDKKLKESENKYRRLFELSGDAIFLMDGEKFIECNEKTLEIFGCKRSEILGKSPYAFSPRFQSDGSNSKTAAKKKINLALNDGFQFFEWRHVRCDGTEFDAQINLGRVEIEGKEFILASVRDVSDFKKAQEIIKDSEERYRIIAEQTGQLVYDYDLESGNIKWAGPIKKVTGYAEKYFQSFDIKKWGNAMSPEDRGPVSRTLSEAIKNKKSFDAVYGLRHKDGHYIGMEDRGVFLMNKNGKPYRMLGTMANITPLLKKDKELEEINTDLIKFKLAAENVSEHIIITDPDGVILFANKGVELITGYTTKEVIGKKPSLWGGQMPKEFYEELWHIIKVKKASFIGEITNKRKNGEIYVAEANISPILNSREEVIFFVGIERDITKAKELDRAKSEFVSVASHQLKTPLSGMKWLLEPILENKDHNLTPKQLEALENVYRNNEDIIRLVNDLLSISRIDSGKYVLLKLGNINMAHFIEGVIKNIESLLCNKNCKIEFKNYLPQNYSLVIDEEKISQVVMNLITNAIKYSKPEGGLVEISARVKNNLFVFSIKDNGIGIPIQSQRHIFEKFYRAENANAFNTSGTGLGLYIGKYFIENHKGKMWFESKEGVGTTFYFTLSQDLL